MAALPELPQLLTADEVAEVFRVNQATVKRWAREGVITSVRLPGTKQHRFRRDDIERLLANPEQVA